MFLPAAKHLNEAWKSPAHPLVFSCSSLGVFLLIPWCFPAQLHSGSWIVDVPSVAGAVLGMWDEAVAAQELPAAPTFQSKV